MTSPRTEGIIALGIPSYNRGEVLCRTISQILPLIGPVVREIIVADQSSSHSPAIAERLQTLCKHPCLRYLSLPRAGVTRARNAILANSSAEFVIFIDDDVIIPDCFFETYLKAFEQSGAIAIQGQVIQFYNLEEFNLPAETLRPRGIPQYGNTSCWMSDLGFIIGANHAVRRLHAIEIGGYDENMSCGASKNEEADFIVRLANHPHDVYYASDCWLIHYSALSGGQRTPLRPVRDEWKKAYTDLLWCFRHGRRLGRFGSFFWKAVRRGPLRKTNIRRFWRQPWAWLAFVYAVGRAFFHRHIILGIDANGNPHKFHYPLQKPPRP